MMQSAALEDFGKEPGYAIQTSTPKGIPTPTPTPSNPVSSSFQSYEFHSLPIQNPLLAFTSVRKRSQTFASVAECRASLAVENCGETQNCRHFFDFASQQCQHSQRSEGSWSRNADSSSLLDLRFVVASEKCQHSHGLGG